MDTITLNNGVVMPKLGLGVWRVPDDQAERAVATAIADGYRLIDTAKLYHNEAGVGRAVRASGVPREELFITTKLWNDQHEDAERAFEASVAELDLDGTLDLYLIHWPAPKQDRYVTAWRALAKLYAEGRVRSIGVSNFTVAALRRLLDETGIVPAVNQIELSPQLAQRELRDFHDEHGIATEAWSPLGSGHGLLDHPVLADIGRAYGKSPAQVVLRWHLQIGDIVIPKSVTPARIAENIDVFDFALGDDDLKKIDGLDEGLRHGPDPAEFG